MRTTATWAFWRRVQYGIGVSVFLLLVGTGIYFAFLFQPASCFDGTQNGDERGVDCGGACVRICSFEIIPPEVLWARSFEIVPGQYNAVTYIENKNSVAATQNVRYTFSLYDETGLITERTGTTVLPPDSVYPIFEGNIRTGARTPTQTFVELEDADVWQPAESGREQFVVEERELRSVDSRPRLDARLRNTAITEAENVEIVATIFDERGNALTASRTVVPRFLGKSAQNVVFTWPQPIAKTIRSCEVPTDVMLAVDLSGSMNDDGGTPPQPITSVLSAADAFVDRLRADDQVGVVTFASEATTEVQLSGTITAVGDRISDLSIAPREETGSTNTGDAIKLVEDEITSARHNTNARKVMVLLTDGLANAPGDEPEAYALEAAASLRNTDTEIFAIGLGEKVNETFLQDMVTDQDHYYFAPSANTVDQIYRSITAAICEDGPAVIDIIPKTSASFTPLER